MKFQKRWFVLKGNLLFYFDKKGDKEPLGLLLLEGCKENSLWAFEVVDKWIFAGTVELSGDEDSQQYCFQLVFHGENDRTYYIGASSQNEMESWMKSLTCVRRDEAWKWNEKLKILVFRRVMIIWSWWCRSCRDSWRRSTVGTKDTRQRVTRRRLHQDSDKIPSTNLQTATAWTQLQVRFRLAPGDAFCFLQVFRNRFFVGWWWMTKSVC